MTLKTAVIQFGAGKDKERNLRRAASLVETAARAGAKFILLPELFVYRGRGSLPELQAASETVPGPTTKTFAKLARKHRTFILLGSLYEKSRGRKVYNTSVLLNPQGRVQAKYRKIHLFDADIGRHALRESQRFLKGKRPVLTKVGPFKVGLSVCFDLRFPELYAYYARKGADILVVPSAFTHKTGQAHWEILVRARAVENQCYVCAPNQFGKDGRGVTSYGHSLIVHPWGDVLAEAPGARTKIMYATLKRQEIQRARKTVFMGRS